FWLKLFRRRRLAADLEAELAFHREMAEAHHNPIPLGNTAVIREQAFDLWRFRFFENLGRDLGYAVRSLARSPGFVLSALASLGLGIGVNTAMFSIATEFLLSRPSVVDADRWVSIYVGDSNHAKPEAVEFLRASGVFEEVVGENWETPLNWNDGRETRSIYSVQTTRNYFSGLGVPVALGRGWTSSDPDNVVVLHHRFWQKYFNGDASIVGRSMNLDGRVYTVLGVLPERHRTLMGYGLSPDVYLPHYLPDTMLEIYARLPPGMSLGQASAALRTVAVRLDQALPDRYKRYANGLKVTPLAGLARLRKEQASTPVGLFFIVLQVLVSLVFLIACVNVASLLLVRASNRRQEIAIRLSLGASRGRLLQQLLAESLLLSLAGAALGFGLAQAVARLLASIQLPVPVPLRLEIEPDWRVVTYAAALAMAATVLCGLFPAWQSVKESLTSNLRRERRLRVRQGLVTVQIGVSVIVLATGSLFLRNLLLARATSPGFDVRNTLRAEVHLPPVRYADEALQKVYFGEALRELGAVPGIEAAAAARSLPFIEENHNRVELTFPRTGQKRNARFHWNGVSPAFFQAMGIPLLAGRTFGAEDRQGAAQAVIVNQNFVDRYLDGRDAVGAVFLWDRQKAPYQIVGVVAGTKSLTIGEGPEPQLYQPLEQVFNGRPQIQFVLRSATPPLTQLAAVRQVLRRIEPGAGVEANTMYSSIGLAFLPSQVGAILMGGAGVLGLFLAAIGLYGVIAYSVARRTREIGVRIAMGAVQGSIARLVLAESAKLLLAGSAAGLAIAYFVTKPLAVFFVPGLGAGDPVSFGAVALVLAAMGLIGTVGPVRRAVRVDPAISLRHE
ncbi:MAG TPA: ADOP family duplicated permease, partial [Bryobacteraceae bacterium]